MMTDPLMPHHPHQSHSDINVGNRLLFGLQQLIAVDPKPEFSFLLPQNHGAYSQRRP